METPSHGNVAAYDWILNQVQDDGYREPHLDEDVLVNQEDEFRLYEHINTHQTAAAIRQAVFRHAKAYLSYGKRRPFTW